MADVLNQLRPLNRELKYWSSQICGWGLYAVLAAIVNRLSGNPYNMQLLFALISVFITGIATTHLYRIIIHQFDLTHRSILKLLPSIIPIIVIFSFFFHCLYSSFAWISLGESPFHQLFENHLLRMLVWLMLLLIWSLIYFGFHYFENFRMEEIKNLKFETARIQTELNNLKSQINPHFLFNALNTIRGLIVENPNKARKSVMQLSNILRKTLSAGSMTQIPFKEELVLVKDYLAIESARYEERLKVTLDIDPSSYKFHVPPLMIQTLVENGIKHGISKLAKGGDIKIISKVEKGHVNITILNSGQLNPSGSNGGLGIENTKRRLSLLYGNNASFYMANTGENMVLTKISIPQTNELL